MIIPDKKYNSNDTLADSWPRESTRWITGKAINRQGGSFRRFNSDKPLMTKRLIISNLSVIVYGLIALVGAITLPALETYADFGDAPDPFTVSPGSYPSLLSSNGARHIDNLFEWLGEGVSTDLDSNQINADQFDDGVRLLGFLFPCNPARVNVLVNTTGEFGRYNPTDPDMLLYLNGWVDWNGDGVWSEEERIFHWGGTADLAAGGIIGEDVFASETFVESSSWEGHPNGRRLTFEITPPPEARIGQAYARFRLDYGENAGNNPQPFTNLGLKNAHGEALYGEAEDYAVMDPVNDLVFHHTGRPASAPGHVDMRFATLRIQEEGAEKRLVMTMRLRESIPDVLPSDAFISYHYLVDLDGNPDTGLPGDEEPVGVIRNMGVDLWIDVGFHPEFGRFQLIRFFDPAKQEFSDFLEHNLPELVVTKHARGLTMSAPLDLIESLAHSIGEVVVDPVTMDWAAVTNFFHGDEPPEGPASDFIPDGKNILLQGDTETCAEIRKWAVVIGVEDQTINQFPDRSGIHDANEVTKLLADNGFKPNVVNPPNPRNPGDGIRMITLLGDPNGRPGQATSARIEGALKWLADKAAKDDMVVIWIAAHGDYRARNGGWFYSSDGLFGAGTLADLIDGNQAKNLKEIAAKRKWIVLDFSKAGNQNPGGFIDSLAKKRPKDRIILAGAVGALGAQHFIKHNDHKHRPLTHFLLQVWRDPKKRADGNKDGMVSILEAFRRAEQLKDLSRAKTKRFVSYVGLKDLTLCGAIPKR
jgi:hypothetical protein